MRALVVGAGATVCVLVLPPLAGATATPPPAPLFVDAREWSLTLSRASVPAGRVSIQLENAGEDDHDMKLARLDRRGRKTGRRISIPLTRPGGLTEKVVTVSRGRWRLWCSLDGHEAKGMRATLRAR